MCGNCCLNEEKGEQLFYLRTSVLPAGPSKTIPSITESTALSAGDLVPRHFFSAEVSRPELCKTRGISPAGPGVYPASPSPLFNWIRSYLLSPVLSGELSLTHRPGLLRGNHLTIIKLVLFPAVKRESEAQGARTELPAGSVSGWAPPEEPRSSSRMN